MFSIKSRRRKEDSSSESASNVIETDSFQGSEEGSTTSLSASVKIFHRENGRTYHGYRAGIYHFPNDPTETERLDYQYFVIQHALSDTLHYAPIPEEAQILDVGTGTGVWAIQMGDVYPNANILGTDLSPIQPTAAPPNVQFIIDDAEQEDWAVPESHYDFIHTRVMMGCFKDFREVIRKGYRHTKPGGWMESQDITMIPGCDDESMPQDWPFLVWSRDIQDAGQDAGRPLDTAKNMKRWYIEAGFEDVQEKVIKLPINTWPRNPNMKALGKWWAENLGLGLQGFSLALLSRINGWNKDEIEHYLLPVRKSMKDRRVHAYHKFYTVCGRKPLPKPPAPEPKPERSVTPTPSTMSSMDSGYDPIATQWYHSHMMRLAKSSASEIYR